MSHSCSSGTCGCDTTDIVKRLKALGSAEEFFTTLGVAYDPATVNVARLHILKRMGVYLAGDDLDGLPDSIAHARAKAMLERAHDDFRRSGPLEERVFKVHKDAVAPKAPSNFVAFATLFDA
jgi:nitrogenase-stabilizing/protective protein